MSNEYSTTIEELKSFCNVLRGDGISYGDFVEALTYMLFLKITDEQMKLPHNTFETIPIGLDWESLLKKSGAELEMQYIKILRKLSNEQGLPGVIFRKSQNHIQTPANLRRFIHLINSQTWSSMPANIKGTFYEEFLQKNAEDTNSKAGQYFTPRPLIKAMVAVMRPEPMQTICDPACGTGGFFLAAYNYISKNFNLNRNQKEFLKFDTFSGTDIDPKYVRLCVMNLLLHGISNTGTVITTTDSLIMDTGERYDVVLSNPPFGTKKQNTLNNGDGKLHTLSVTYEREDFSVKTSNRQLNFLQHIKTILKQNGKAAVALPDSVLFKTHSGKTIRKELLTQFDFHTLLRLPIGIFYKPGVKANVLFFDKRPAREAPWTKKLWIYDLRTNKHFTLKKHPMSDADLQDFITVYKPENRHERVETERFRAFSYEEFMERHHINT